MADISGLNDLEKKLNSLNFTRSEKAEVSHASANVIASVLEANTPVDLENEHGTHLKDLVTFKDNEYIDGSTDVGYTKDGYYAKFANDGHQTVQGRHYHTTRNGTQRMKKVKYYEHGTKKTKALHFMETTFMDSKGEATLAAKKKAMEIMHRKGL